MTEEKSVLRVGGLAGVLAGIFIVVALITFVILLPAEELEEALADFPDDRALLTVTIDLFLVGLLLFLPFLAALYWSLKERNRVFARIGLGSGILAIVVTVVALVGFLLAADTFSGLYEDAATQDRPAVVAIYGGLDSLLGAGLYAGFLFTGLAFVAFGLAMRGIQDFGEGLAWLSVVLGIIAVLFTFIDLPPVAIAAAAVFTLVLGWKVYSLSRAAGAG